jgi:hypothetical protein
LPSARYKALGKEIAPKKEIKKIIFASAWPGTLGKGVISSIPKLKKNLC